MENQMERFIDNMQSKGMNTVVCSIWYFELKSNVDKCKEYHKNGLMFYDTNEYERKEVLFNNLYGFIWGAYTVGFLNIAQRDKLLQELIEECVVIPKEEIDDLELPFA